MPATATRGAQVVLDGDAQKIARGTYAPTFDANHTAMRNGHVAGTIPDGNKPDGSTRTGGAATEIMTTQPPLQAFANDAAAAAGGILIGGYYRTASAVMIRVA